MTRHAMTLTALMPFHAAPHDALGARGRRWLSAGVLLAHLAGAWALLQMDTVRQAVAQAAPALMVQLIALADPPRPTLMPPAPPPSALRPPPPLATPVPTLVIDAAPSPAPAPPSVATPVAETAPPAPVQAAPVAATVHATPAPPVIQTPVPSAAKKIPGTALRYLVLPRLNFPLLSRRANESGEVVLRIVVDANGQLKAAWVHKSSGFVRIDQAALQDIRSARFQPYLEDGKAVEVESLAVLAYDLDR